jgi:Sugar (pentulose and hexulose) kinases
MSDHYLIIDLGASNGRAMVAEFTGTSFTFDIVHRFENRPVFAQKGEFFWDILNVFLEVKIGIQKAVKKYGKLRSMAIDSWGCDFGIIDAQGRLMANPLHYRDRSQHELSAKLHSIMPEEELYQLSCGPCNRIMGIYKLFSMMQQGYSEYLHGHRLMMVPDLLNYFLTDVVSNEFTNATMTLLVDQRTRAWEPKIMEKLGLRTDLYTPLTEPGTILGPLSGRICKEMEIDPITVVIPATHDTASAVTGIPVLDTKASWGFISLGTWGLAGLETAHPVMDSRLVKSQFGNEGGANGKNMLLKNITGLWIIQQCREKWNKDAGHEVPWDEICSQADAAKKQNSVFDVDEARFGMYQADMPGVVAEFCRATGQDVPSSLGEVARCVHRSLAYKFKDSFAAVTEVTGVPLDVVHVVGGGSQDRLLCQWTADAVGIRVLAGPTETTAVGNLIFQLLADGKIGSLDEGRELSANSSEIIEHLPHDTVTWDADFAHYRRIVNL